MGAFYLFHYRIENDKTQVVNMFKKRGFNKPIECQCDEYSLMLFNKILTPRKQYMQNGDDFIGYIGTMVYKGLNEPESLQELYADIKNQSIDEEHLIGHFICIEYIDFKIRILTDRLCFLPLYYSEDGFAVSSSLIAIACSKPGSFTISSQAMLENILAHGVVPPDTQFNEIKRWIPSLGLSKINSIDIYSYKQTDYANSIRSFNQAVEEQINRLDEYMDQIKKTIYANGVRLGLSSGFDSRLLLALLLRHGIEPECYTNWEYGVSKDYIISNDISKKMGFNLAVLKAHKLSHTTSTENEIPDFDEGYLYTDGQIRSECFWDEIYNTMEYYKLVPLSSSLGFSGVGGEQYRNAEGFKTTQISLDKWIKKHVLYNYYVINNHRLRNDFLERYIVKVRNILNINDHIDGFGIKKYYNEIYGYANRHFRSIFPNQVIYHLSPFSDAYNSLFAYRAIPYLGHLYRFEMEMINKINPKLASFQSHYGFNFKKNIPIHHVLKLALKNSISPSMRLKIRSIRRNYKSNKLESNINVSNLVNKLGINVDIISRDPEKLQLIKQMLYYYNRMGNK